MMGFLLAAGIAYMTGEVYKRLVPSKRKREFEEGVKIHHGEVGAVMTAAGLIMRSPTLAGFGIGLMLHDRNDYKKWFAER